MGVGQGEIHVDSVFIDQQPGHVIDGEVRESGELFPKEGGCAVEGDQLVEVDVLHAFSSDYLFSAHFAEDESVLDFHVSVFFAKIAISGSKSKTCLYICIMDNHVVIMAGGIGSRFWPMSTPQLPKQFVDILGTGRTLIQMTADRFAAICHPENIWVVTGRRYVGLVKQQLPQIPEDHIIAEPEARNTAPCIAYAAWKIRMKYPEANVVFTPSDALVLNVEEFTRIIKTALLFTAKQNTIVTVGIRPGRPETGYGYIEAGEPIPGTEIIKVGSFREKPTREVAQEYLKQGKYLWNAGIFAWNVETIVESMRQHAPALAAIMDEMSQSFYTEREEDEAARLFPTCEKISIDYAVMEKSDCIYTVPADFGWSDLGTWGSLHTLMPHDESNNAAVGTDVRMIDSKNCIVHTPDLSKVVVQGLDGYIVAQHGDRLLICRLEDEQNITQYAK